MDETGLGCRQWEMDTRVKILKELEQVIGQSGDGRTES